jgi:hypothetical protein
MRRRVQKPVVAAPCVWRTAADEHGSTALLDLLVVALHLIDRAGEPTRAAVDEILEFFAIRLKG